MLILENISDHLWQKFITLGGAMWLPGLGKEMRKQRQGMRCGVRGGTSLLRKKQLGRGSRPGWWRPEKVPVIWERRLGFPSTRHSDEMRRGPRIWEGAGHTKQPPPHRSVQNKGEGQGQKLQSQGPLMSGRPAGTRPSSE